MSLSNARFQPHGLRQTSRRGQRRPFGRFFGTLAFLGFFLLAGLPSAAQAATDSLFAAPAAAGAGDCSSPANACSIATAVTNANADPVADSVRIELASGTYSLSSPSPTALPITFAGPSLTLEPENGTPILDGTNTVSLLSVGATSNVTIDGLEIENGHSAGQGGGISDSGTLTVENSTFSHNTAGNGGAIAELAGGTLTVRNSTFSNNSTTGVGGGAIIVDGTTTVLRSAILNNSAPVNGGGINVQSSGVATVASSTLAGNTSGSLGGATSNLGRLTVEASTIIGNSSAGGSAVATGNTNVTFAADIIAAQTTGTGCNPANLAGLDAGYNLDTDGTCVSATTPATGSHSGTTADGSSTYAAVLDSYLADAPANNGGPTETIALLNTPSPATTLPNPALAVVPASFNLPVAVDGVAAACSLSDQRGVVPVAGRNCNIGSYLLQTTTTALTTSATQVAQTQAVTYTATITPAPDAGTVSFNDGAGNPATAQCAAQSVSNGTATCTVSYANAGTYSVTATYSGDGGMNNFVGSASPAQTVGVQPAANLVLHKRASKARAYPGQQLTYRLTIKNSGPSAAGNVKVADTPALPIKVISIHASQGSCSAHPSITCTLGTLAAGNTASVTIVAEVKAGGLQRNTATATSTTTLLNSQDATAAATTRVTPILRLRVKASPATARTGQNVTYRISVTNPTLVAIAQVSICDKLPSGLLYLRSRPKANVRTGRPCWTITRLPAGRSQQFTVVANVAPGTGGTRVNRVSATARNVRAVQATASVNVTRTPQAPCAVASRVLPTGPGQPITDPIARPAC
jgi:uncharacterized repeat protein (TIGR01451 family)